MIYNQSGTKLENYNYNKTPVKGKYIFFCHTEIMYKFALTKKCSLHARVAELVDALVSNTSDSNIVPVRSRPRVQ